MYASKLTNRREFLRLTVAGAIGTAMAAACAAGASPSPTTAPVPPTGTPGPEATANTAPQASPATPASPTATIAPKPTNTPAPAAMPAAAVTPTQTKRAVALAGIYGGPFADAFTNSFKGFTDSTGIAVNYSNPPDQGSPDFFQWIAAGMYADVVDVSIPNLIQPAAKQGKVVDLNKALGAQVLKDSYDQLWLDWATMAGPSGTIVGGLFTLSFLQGVVWYPKAVFDKAGYVVPTTWDEMIALSDRIVKAGGTPWGFGNGDGSISPMYSAEILLRTASLEDYDRHWRGEIRFNSPQVRKAVQLMHDLWLKPGYAYGGKQAINTTQMWDPPKMLFNTPPKLWMDYAPSYLPVYDGSSEATDFLSKKFGTDYDFFLLPEIDSAHGAPVQVESHIASMLRDTDEARALMGYIASGDQGEAFVKQGNMLGGTPRKGAKLEWYPDAFGRRVAEVIQKAPKMRMWANDLFPFSVAVQIGISLMDYLDGKITLDSALKKSDDAWALVG